MKEITTTNGLAQALYDITVDGVAFYVRTSLVREYVSACERIGHPGAVKHVMPFLLSAEERRCETMFARRRADNQITLHGSHLFNPLDGDP
jgi:hypothetical protein